MPLPSADTGLLCFSATILRFSWSPRRRFVAIIFVRNGKLQSLHYAARDEDSVGRVPAKRYCKRRIDLSRNGMATKEFLVSELCSAHASPELL